MPATLTLLMNQAFAARSALLTRLAEAQTNAYRLFHGDAEGMPGVSIDRYSDLLLVQSFKQALSPEQLSAIAAFYATAIPGLTLVYNQRNNATGQISNPLDGEQLEAAMAPREVEELGVQYHLQARHGGQEPWLPLDTRAARRRLMSEVAGKAVLNLFAYTGSAGLAAAKAGARHVINVESDETNVMVAKDNVRLNNALATRPRFVHSDNFAAARQLAGIGQAELVRGKRMPAFPKLEARQFDVVFLDPPVYAKSMFGVVDQLNDYASVFKPALLATAPGSTLICTNRVPTVDAAAWLDQLQRSAAKAGRPVSAFEWINPEADFPAVDGQAALKIVLLRV